MLQLWVIYPDFTLLFKPWHEIGWSPNISLIEGRKTLILSLLRDERKGKIVFTSKLGQKLAITSFSWVLTSTRTRSSSNMASSKISGYRL
ncbi:hypothetical protein ES288_D02G170700v1 [Gossypium darwinii]|uniref:Uncharacterized protein n=1 Tax=Gossypium darwinii TaxID=34276 RepID=A0A5D2DH37_GOSDA|nr:hypothetical protein ES288_D02G170700v1 [Gossypium darwinii]